MSVYNPSGSGNVHVDRVISGGKGGKVAKKAVPAKKAMAMPPQFAAAAAKKAGKKAMPPMAAKKGAKAAPFKKVAKKAMKAATETGVSTPAQGPQATKTGVKTPRQTKQADTMVKRAVKVQYANGGMC